MKKESPKSAPAKKSAAKNIKKKVNVAVVGATGLVGGAFLKLIERRGFQFDNLYLFASERSKNTKIKFMGETFVVDDVKNFKKHDYDVAFFSAGTQVSLDYAPKFADHGALVVDNSAAFRMQEGVPLVVPEINFEDALLHKGIIANPNCSTIQMLLALWPLHKACEIKRVVVTTFQSVSGTGTPAIEELRRQSTEVLEKGIEESYRHNIKKEVYPHQIAFNCLAHIDKFEDDGYTKEEHKMVNETRKIFHEPKFRLSATTVRVPVFRGHSEAVNIEFKQAISPGEASAILKYAPGVTLIDDVSKNQYPTPLMCEWQDDVFVGRIRADKSVRYGLDMWVVADNILKGAALNGIQIVEKYFGMKVK